MSANNSVVGIDETDPGSRADLSVWLFFQIAAGHVGLPILVATFLLAKSVTRHPTLINMCITWIISGISSALLFYAGKQSGPEPSRTLCVAQASLLYGVPPMCSLAAFALVFIVWSSFSASMPVEPRKGKIGLYGLLVAPYVAWLAFVVITAVQASQDVESVSRHRRFFYCSFENSPLSNAMAIFSAAVCLASLLLEIHVLTRLSRNWRGLSNPTNSSEEKRGLDKQLIVRLFIFSGFLVIALVFSAISVLSPQTVVPDMFAASIGMAVFIVFGTQSDVLRVWAFWLPKRTPELSQEESYYVPRELKYGDGPLDSSFDFGSEKSTLAPFENIGHAPTPSSMRNGVTASLSLPITEGSHSTPGSVRSSRISGFRAGTSDRDSGRSQRPVDALVSLQKTTERV